MFCHGTPWSSALWAPFAQALAASYTVHLWDMPGFGLSSKDADHAVSLDVQGQLYADLLDYWGLDAPHVVAHDIGGAVALRSHLLHQRRYASLALVDVVAVAPWGSDYFRLVREHADVFAAVPEAMHEGALRAYVRGASHQGLTDAALEELVSPWRGPDGQPAFYRQVAQASQEHTDDIEPAYAGLDLPVLIVWGTDDSWIPVDRAQQLAHTIPGAQLRLVTGAGHLIQLDQPIALATILANWLSSQGPPNP